MHHDNYQKGIQLKMFCICFMIYWELIGAKAYLLVTYYIYIFSISFVCTFVFVFDFDFETLKCLAQDGYLNKHISRDLNTFDVVWHTVSQGVSF